MVEPLRVVFMGTPEFAVPTLEHLLASPHRVVGVFTQPDRRRGRGQKVSPSPVKAVALAHGVPVLQPEKLRDAAVHEALRELNPDLGVVAAYGKLIPEHLLTTPRLGMINVHASLLPRHRGAAPVHRAVIAGDRETGVTIMRVIKELDAGAMFAKVVRPIGEDETSDLVEKDLARLGASLLVDIVNQLAAGTAREEEQDARLATYAPRLTKEEGAIDWRSPARAIHNQVRGLHPWPLAFTSIGGHRIIVRRTHVGERAASAPGSVLSASRDGIAVAAGDGGVVVIDELQPEGRRPMRAHEFLAGHPLPAGTVLGGP
jgi:methionyl-tRNA formyltransferase